MTLQAVGRAGCETAPLLPGEPRAGSQGSPGHCGVSLWISFLSPDFSLVPQALQGFPFLRAPLMGLDIVHGSLSSERCQSQLPRPPTPVIPSKAPNNLIRIDLLLIRSSWLFLMNLGIFKPFFPLKKKKSFQINTLVPVDGQMISSPFPQP